VVKLHDGTYHHIALIDGDTSYTDFMRRRATAPSVRTPDYFDTRWEMLQYLKSRMQRLANKLVGRPATPETAVLASMVSKLVEKTQAWLGDKHTIIAAALSSPDHLRLTTEEISDVFDYLSLRNLMAEPPLFYELGATSAAYAGYGKGLCRSYTDAYACEREEWKLPLERVLHLDLNSEILSGTIKSPQSARDGSVDASFVDSDLGFGRERVRLFLASREGHDNEQYWTSVSDRIRELVKSFNRVYLPHMTELLLTGPYATNKCFQGAVWAAIHDLVADDSVLSLLENRDQAVDKEEEWQTLFSFATARGAAEFAKRMQEGPFKCAQSSKCRRRRELVHDEGELSFIDQQADVVLAYM
jgi:hypothetical protein